MVVSRAAWHAFISLASVRQASGTQLGLAWRYRGGRLAGLMMIDAGTDGAR
jgi:hypothetical protein